jgi:hypothetical protein
MATFSPIDEIYQHWTQHLTNKGISPLSKALKSYQVWYTDNMVPDVRIDDFFQQINHAEKIADLIRRRDEICAVEANCAHEKSEIDAQLLLLKGAK